MIFLFGFIKQFIINYLLYYFHDMTDYQKKKKSMLKKKYRDFLRSVAKKNFESNKNDKSFINWYRSYAKYYKYYSQRNKQVKI